MTSDPLTLDLILSASMAMIAVIRFVSIELTVSLFTLYARIYNRIVKPTDGFMCQFDTIMKAEQVVLIGLRAIIIAGALYLLDQNGATTLYMTTSIVAMLLLTQATLIGALFFTLLEIPFPDDEQERHRWFGYIELVTVLVFIAFVMAV